MLFKKKIVTPDMTDWHHDPNQLILLDSHTKVTSLSYIPNKALVVFIGGAMDEIYRPLLNGVFIPYRLKQADHQDVCYATHASSKPVVALVKRWSDAGQKICLVGHSWGGNTVLRVAKKISPEIKVSLLITLDPVSRRLFRRQQKKPDSVNQWINVHVDYGLASMEYSNMIARMGGYWGACRYADKNIRLSHDYDQEITHAKAWRMFLEVEELVVSV
jgi:hypothetical protein